jgi:transcriptional regulator with XRE-family HTH domain
MSINITLEPVLGNFFEWKKTNPILVWRKKNKITRSDAGLMIGVSMTTVQSWESGATMPSRLNMPHIARAMGITTERFSQEYNAWLSRVGRQL